MIRALVVIVAAVLLWTSAARAEDPQGCWSYRGEGGSARRWVFVHPATNDGAIFHIEAARSLQRPPGYERLSVHMAITREALTKSLIQPLKRCMQFYPEMYDSAFAAWQKAGKDGHAQVCKTSISACLQTK